MPDFSKKNTKDSGGKYGDKDWTVDSAMWVEETKGTNGFNGIFYRWEMTDAAGESATKDWLLGDADALRAKIVVADDGTLEDVDADNPYQPRKNDETSALFNSMEEAGLSPKILSNIGLKPDGVVGYTFHMIEQPTGKKQTKKVNGVKVETQYDQTRLIVESIVSSPGKPAAGKSAGKPATTAAGGAKKGRPAPVVEPDEEEEETTDEDPIEQAAIATVQTVLAAPKKFVPTFNAKQHGGGVTTTQMAQAALGNAIPKEHKAVGKPPVQKLVRNAEFGEKFNGELWNFDSDEGVYSLLDE